MFTGGDAVQAQGTSRSIVSLLAGAIIVVLLVGCHGQSSTTDAGETGTTTATPPSIDGSVTTSVEGSEATSVEESDVTSEPPTEPTGPETPQKSAAKPSVTFANLPIGGSGPVSDGCASAPWISGEIPPGVSVTVDSIEFDPGDIFEEGGGGCGSKPQCRGWTWKSGDGEKPCYVSVRQVDPSAVHSVSMRLNGTVTCDEPATCQEFKDKAPHGAVELIPEATVSPSEPSPSEPSPIEQSPSESTASSPES